jgi:K+-transporting ATPase KdpF subunit
LTDENACAFRPIETEVSNARSHDVDFHGGFLRRGVSLRQSLPEVEVAMDLITAIALVFSVLLLVYLTISLLYPEKF